MFTFSRFLLYFTETARQGSFHKASEALRVSASSIDHQTLRVEQELTMSFFERHPTELRLTAAGKPLLHVANSQKKDFARVCEQLDDLRGLRRGHVCIVAIDAINRHFFSMMLEEVHKHYPNIPFTLTAISSTHIQQALASGEADFGITLNPQTSRELQVWVFTETNMGIVVPTSHPLTSYSAMRFGQCIGCPFILPSAPLMISEPVEVLVNISSNKVEGVTVSNNIHMVRILIKRQVGIGTLYRLDILDEAESGQLAFMPLTDPQLKPFTLALRVSPTRQLSLAVSMMSNRLEMFFSQL